MHDATLYKQCLNRLLRDESELSGAEGRIAFFCECGDASCLHPIWLTLPEYDEESRARGRWLLARGHEPAGLLAGTGA